MWLVRGHLLWECAFARMTSKFADASNEGVRLSIQVGMIAFVIERLPAQARPDLELDQDHSDGERGKRQDDGCTSRSTVARRLKSGRTNNRMRNREWSAKIPAAKRRNE